MTRKNQTLETAPQCPWGIFSRRDFLKCAAAATAVASTGLITSSAPSAPSNKTLPRTVTGVDLCKRYEYPVIRRKLAKLFDEIGGVRQLVKGKFVTAKVNLVNAPNKHVSGVPQGLTTVIHPAVALAAGSLLVEYGAKKVTFCDQLPLDGPDEESFALYDFHLQEFSQEMDGKVAFENTRNLGRHKNYALVKTPGGGYIANAWEVNRAYSDTDVLISIAKLKSHVSGGVSLGMKNLFGVPPSSMYGDDIYGENKNNEPDESAVGYRGYTMHTCSKKPLTSVDSFTGKSVLDDHGYNVPHLIADLNYAFPIELVVIDGISTIQSAEGWWIGPSVSVAAPAARGALASAGLRFCGEEIGRASCRERV